jgi:SpoVK/Ycf46/Vps4 family AAA+-type ATPase
MLELLNQLDGFDTRGDVKVIMATNRIKSLDLALIRLGRIDCKIEFPLRDVKTKRYIFRLVLLSYLSILQLPEYLVAYTPVERRRKGKPIKERKNEELFARHPFRSA